MRILEIETFGRGGLIHYAYNLSCALAERGHEVTLLTTAGYELEGLELPANMRVIRAMARLTQGAGWSGPAVLASLVRKVEAVIDAVRATLVARRLQPDVVHLHCTNQIALVYQLLIRLLRVPLVSTAHVVTPHEEIGFQEAIYRRIHRSSDLIVAHSSFDRQRLIGEFAIEPEKVTVIPHGEYGFVEQGADLPDRDAARQGFGLEPDEEVALFFGYIREYKGLDVLLEAWPGVVDARPRARLIIAGDPIRLDPARRAELEAWASRVGALYRFQYIPLSEVPRYFAAADALVLPYRHISQSGVLFLALSLNLPVVATAVGPLPEVLRDGDSAVLVPPESPTALAAGLVRVLGDTRLRERLVDGGRQVAEKHSWSEIARLTEDAFVHLTESRRRG